MGLVKHLSTARIPQTSQEAAIVTEEMLCNVIVELALGLALAGEGAADRDSAFAETLGQLVAYWPRLARVCRPCVHRFCEELPVTRAQHFWPLLVRLRAMM